MREAPREIIQQKTRPAVLVRLENADQPPRAVMLAQRQKRRPDFRRVMPVIIHDCHGRIRRKLRMRKLPQKLRPPVRPAERFHRRLNLIP